MSGITRLANAMANDPSFSADGLISRSEAKKIVSAEDPKMPQGIKPPKAPTPGMMKRNMNSSYSK